MFIMRQYATQKIAKIILKYRQLRHIAAAYTITFTGLINRALKN